MGSCMSSSIYKEFPNISECEILFTTLKLYKRDVRRLHERVFQKIDISRDGSVTVKEIFAFFDLDLTPFIEKMFNIFFWINSSHKEYLTFKSVVLILWNFLTLNKKAVVSDNSVSVEVSELMLILKEIYGRTYSSNPFAQGLMDKFLSMQEATGGYAKIDVKQMDTFCSDHQAFLYPVFQLKNALQRLAVGKDFWTTQSRRRGELLKNNTISKQELRRMHDLHTVSFKDFRLVLEDPRSTHAPPLTSSRKRSSMDSATTARAKLDNPSQTPTAATSTSAANPNAVAADPCPTPQTARTMLEKQMFMNSSTRKQDSESQQFVDTKSAYSYIENEMMRKRFKIHKKISGQILIAPLNSKDPERDALNRPNRTPTNGNVNNSGSGDTGENNGGKSPSRRSLHHHHHHKMKKHATLAMVSASGASDGSGGGSGDLRVMELPPIKSTHTSYRTLPAIDIATADRADRDKDRPKSTTIAPLKKRQQAQTSKPSREAWGEVGLGRPDRGTIAAQPSGRGLTLTIPNYAQASTRSLAVSSATGASAASSPAAPLIGNIRANQSISEVSGWT